MDTAKREELLNKAILFHGHLCRGLLIGFRMAVVGLEHLGVEAAADEELVAVAQNENCGVDGLQVVSGCTVGKGNLLLRDYGKQVYILGNRNANEAVRVALRTGAREKMKGDSLTPEQFFAIPEEELFKVEKIEFSFPPKASIFSSVICQECGESVMEPRARVKDGKIVCQECAAEYPARWQ